MTFAELLEEVYLITNRRDLEAQTKSAVKKATIKAHLSDFYWRDFYETGIEFEESSMEQIVDLNSMFSNFRALRYFKIVDNETDAEGRLLEEIPPEDYLDEYGYLRNDVFYVAGRNVKVRAACNFDKALVGMYVLPTVTEDEYSSWVADLVPYFIIHEAARAVLRTIGYLEESNEQKREVAEQLSLLKQTGLATVGY